MKALDFNIYKYREKAVVTSKDDVGNNEVLKRRSRDKFGSGNERSSVPDYDGKRMLPSLSVSECDSVSLRKRMNKSASLCFGGFFNSKVLHKTLEYASDNGAVLGAAVAAFTSVILRPATILALPNVEKENKQYACTKSIASSLLGYGILYTVTKPIATALKKINKEPAKYLTDATMKRLSEAGKSLTSSKKYMLATKTFSMGSDFAFAIPKAILTVALIPPIMSLIFGKKKVNENAKTIDSIVQFKGNNKNSEKTYEIFKDFLGDKK